MNSLEPSQPLDNAQQEHFAQLVAKGAQSQGACYAETYGRDEVDDTAYNNASRLLGNARISARITHLKERGAEAAVVSVEMVLKELVENVNSAKQGNPVFNRQGEITGHRRDFSAVNRGLELLGKSLDMFKDGVVFEDKREQRPMADYSKMTPEELKAARDELLQRDN